MNKAALALLLGLPAAFGAGWWLHPSAVSGEAAAGSITGTAHNRRSVEAGPGTGSRERTAAPGRKPATGRTFPQGGAAQWLRSLGGLEMIQNSASRDALREIMEKFTPEEFAELDREVREELQDPDLPGAKKKFAVRLLILAWPEWVRADPAATLASMAWAGAVDEDFLSHDSVVQTVFRRYAGQDQEAAIAAIARLPENRRKDAGHGVMTAVSLRDPFAALELIPQLGPAASGDPRSIVDAAVARDPMRTATLTGPVSGDAPRDNTFLRAMEQWSEADPAAAAAWLESYQGPGKVTGLTATLAARVKTDAPGAAARYLTLENPEQNPYTSRLAGTIALGLSYQAGPADAMEWAAKIPGNPGMDAATAVMSAWVKTDAAAASGWISAQPPGPLRENATLMMIPHIQSSDPEGAWEWAKSLSAPGQRNAALTEVSNAWRKQDPAAAQTALDSLSSDLPAAVETPQPPVR